MGTALLFGFLVKVPAGAVYLLRRQVDARALLRLLLGGPGGASGKPPPHAAQGGKGPGPPPRGPHRGPLGGAWALAGPEGGRTREGKALASSPGGLRHRPRVGFSSAGAGALGTLLLLHATRLSPRRWWAPTSSSASSSPSWGRGPPRLRPGGPKPPPRPGLGRGGGGLLGALFATRLPKEPLRLALLLWLLFIGGQLVYRGVVHG